MKLVDYRECFSSITDSMCCEHFLGELKREVVDLAILSTVACQITGSPTNLNHQIIAVRH